MPTSSARSVGDGPRQLRHQRDDVGLGDGLAVADGEGRVERRRRHGSSSGTNS
ncbi:MAG: hypothetical protein MZV64_13605 [Ignavibacteriales bacterium]|nr:hypothetical protein [Ignavibacteriales bacterium]